MMTKIAVARKGRYFLHLAQVNKCLKKSMRHLCQLDIQRLEVQCDLHGDWGIPFVQLSIHFSLVYLPLNMVVGACLGITHAKEEDGNLTDLRGFSLIPYSFPMEKRSVFL